MADGGDGRRDACANACADRGAFLSEGRRGDARACLEVGDAHARVVAEAMHIARLQCVEIGEAGITKGLGNLRRCEGRPHAPSWPRNRLAFVGPRQASRKGATMESAMRVRVTRCSPCQAGMLFTSSTRGAPSRSWMMSTPA